MHKIELCEKEIEQDETNSFFNRKKRSHLKILLEILEYVNQKSYYPKMVVIHVMCRELCIPYVRLKKMINHLNQHGIIRLDKEEKCIKITLTEKGTQLMNLLKTIRNVLRQFRIEI